MNKYEMTLVVAANVDEEVRNAAFDKVRGYITKNGGNITDPGTPEKKKLAYEIQKMKDGYYYFIQFEGDSESPAKLEANLRIMDNVLRYLVVKQDAE